MARSDPKSIAVERVVRLAHETDFVGWRDAARALAMAGVDPASIVWQVPSNSQESLLAAAEDLPAPPPNARRLAVARAFVERAETVICHSDPARFDLLYRMLWHLRAE